MTHDPFDVAIGARLRFLRAQRRLSMSAVSRELGVTYQQVRKYEDGANRISAATLFKLAQLLDVEIADFFDGLPRRSAPGGAEAAPVEATLRALDAALERIDDGEVRYHLRGLLQALGSAR